MEILINNKQDLLEIIDILYHHYFVQMNRFDGLSFMKKDEFTRFVITNIDKYEVISLKDEKCIVSVVLYALKQKGKSVKLDIPLFGYGIAKQERKYLSILLDELYKKIIKDTGCKQIDCDAKLYSCDTDIINLFEQYQFGIQAVSMLNKIAATRSNDNYCVSRLDQSSIKANWKTIYKIIKDNDTYLSEFKAKSDELVINEKTIKEKYLDADSIVYVAKTKDEIVGIMLLDDDNDEYVLNGCKAKRVVDVNVVDEYRGKGVSDELLSKIQGELNHEFIRWLNTSFKTSKQRAYNYFAHKFDCYSYSMKRVIEIK